MATLSRAAVILAFLHALTARASPIIDIFGRAINDKCTAPLGVGSCQNTSNCEGISYATDLCPYDPNDVQCCLTIVCNTGSATGYCRSKSNNGCPGGAFHPNFCPGDDDIQCCVKSDSGPAQGSTTSAAATPTPTAVEVSTSTSNLGQKVLDQAERAKGTPYFYGGGSCSGPTGGGYDCSGLVSWAICKVTGRDLFSEGLRVTYSMYCASESKLKYPKVPYSQRRAGDLVFFGGKCDCSGGATAASGVHHVGIMMDSGTTMWNALETGTLVRSDNFGSWSEKPCPYVIRLEDASVTV